MQTHLPLRRALLASSALAAAATFAHTAFAQDFPSRAITIVVPFGAGGGPDRTVRLFAEKMQASLKQPVVIEYSCTSRRGYTSTSSNPHSS